MPHPTLLDPAFSYKDGQLYAEEVAVADIAAQVGTPFYLYSTASIARQYRRLRDAVAGLNATICYAVKANSNQAVLATLKHMGAGADVVSTGELKRALAAGIPAEKIVFAGVGKQPEEMRFALSKHILQFNVESVPELQALNAIAGEMGLTAPIALRINPDVDAKTHAKITTGTSENKFGVSIEQALAIGSDLSAYPHIALEALSMHIGSQLLHLDPYDQAFARMAELTRALQTKGVELKRLDIGGGLGIAYTPDTAPPEDQVERYAGMIRKHFASFGLPLVLEPGRYMVGNAGLMVSEVVYVKKGLARQFLILDSAMNDLIRPTLYDAHHEIVPLRPTEGGTETYDIVGPVCESGDTFATNRQMPSLKSGDLIAMQSAGAYSAVMASTYNARALAPEVLVKGSDFAVVRARQSIEELIELDQVPAWL